MAARVIDGQELAERIRRETAARVEELRSRGVSVRLDAVLVGAPDAGTIYARSQAKRCAAVGIDHRLHTLAESVGDGELQDYIGLLSRDPQVTGILLNLPLPKHLDTPAAQYAIDPYKDVEGVNPANIGLLFYGKPIIAPCTALAVMAVLREIGQPIRGRRAVVVGQGDIVGKPIALALMGEEATVIAANEFTPDLPRLTREADILVAAAGVPELIWREHVGEGALVIDVGINRRPADPARGIEAGVVGDVRFDEAAQVASAITPVPGGVGPVTVAILLQSVVEAAGKQLGGRRIR